MKVAGLGAAALSLPSCDLVSGKKKDGETIQGFDETTANSSKSPSSAYNPPRTHHRLAVSRIIQSIYISVNICIVLTKSEF